MKRRYIHIPPEDRYDVLSSETKAAINDDYEDYQSYGGMYTFKAWLAHYHQDIYTKVYLT